MNQTMRECVLACPHCGGRLNDWFQGNFPGRFFNERLNVIVPKYFCTKECYKSYSEKFIVEVYNDQPIYCVEVAGEKRYMPYFEASYYFTDINDCKKRMDMHDVAVVDLQMLGLPK